MTRGEIKTRILEALGESATDPRFWTSSEINDLIDEAQEILVEEITEIRRSALLPLRAGTFYYHTQSIANDVMVPYRIWDVANEKRLACVTLTELDERHQRWVDTTDDPDVWCPLSWDLFLVWPGAAAGGELLKVDYLAWPKTIDDDDEEPELPVGDHEGLVLYGVYDGFLKLWDMANATAIFARFLERIPRGKSRGARILHDSASVARTPGVLPFRSGVRS